MTGRKFCFSALVFTCCHAGMLRSAAADGTPKLYCAKDSTISSLAIEGDHLTWGLEPDVVRNVVQNNNTVLLAIRSYTGKSVKTGTEAPIMDVIFVDFKSRVLQDILPSKYFQYEKPFEAKCQR